MADDGNLGAFRRSTRRLRVGGTVDGAADRDGGAVTITHPEVSRGIVTTEEGVQPVVQAGTVGQAGWALMLEKGEPVRIIDLAREWIGEMDPGSDIASELTGLRPGKKPTEAPAGTGELALSKPHDPIGSLAAGQSGVA